MTGLFKFLGLLTDIVIKILRAKGIKDAQKDFDNIDSNPAAEFMRRFRRKKDTAEPTDKTKS